MFDIDGYLTSTEFLVQLASLIVAILSSVLTGWISGWFGAV
jgi:hypothetical protein